VITDNSAEFRKLIEKKGRLLGIDYGTVRIGIAISDINQTIATPKEIIDNEKFSLVSSKIKKICSEEKIVGMVIGLPKNIDGSESKISQSVRQFGKNLLKEINLPLLLWDERWSSVMAEKALIEANVSREKRIDKVDKVAASYILQGALDSLKNII
jgi:putative holliday junction resolvase